jgi:hypothetical protein
MTTIPAKLHTGRVIEIADGTMGMDGHKRGE